MNPCSRNLPTRSRSGDFFYEPKWDGFRAIIFRGTSDVFIQSRDLRPLDRYFPELHEAAAAQLPAGSVVDGEIVIARGDVLDFDALQMRLHPAASRVAKLSKETPAAFVGVRSAGRQWPRSPRHAAARASSRPGASARRGWARRSISRRSRAIASWRWTGSRGSRAPGLDGVIAKPLDLHYQPGKRAMLKIKHVRTADCVVGGFRWHKSGRDRVGSLLLGLYDRKGTLHHVGITSAFTMAARKALVDELAPLRVRALEGHPWRDWAEADGSRMPGGQSRWSAGQGPVVGAAAHRARGGSEVRPPAGRPIPTRDDLSALAAGQAAKGLPVRSAGRYRPLRALTGVWSSKSD